MSVSVDTMRSATPARLRGLDVLLEFHVDDAELERRRSHSVQPHATAATTLASLLHIPVMASVPVATLPGAVQTVARRHSQYVEFTDGTLVRRRVSPIGHVTMVTVPSRHWRKALRDVGRFAPYTARRLLLSAEPTDLDVLRMEATYWGVGVRLEQPEGWHDVVHPAPFTPERFTGASWAFAEAAVHAAQQAAQPSVADQRAR